MNLRWTSFAATIRANIFLAVAIFGAFAHGAGQCGDLFAATRARVVETEGFANQADSEMLINATRKMLDFYARDFDVPSEVYFVNMEGGPQYIDGIVKARFPMYRDFYEPAERLYKSSKDSIRIHLHEVAHAIFEKVIAKIAKERPEVSWAFTTRLDMLGEYASIQNFQETKHRTRFAQKEDSWLLEHFGSIRGIADAYNELFADMLPVLFEGDPNFIYNGIAFPSHPERFDRLRSFDRDHPERDVADSLKQDEHGIMATTRTFIWREVYKPFHFRKVRPLSESLIAKTVVEAMIESIRDLTNDFTETGEKHDAAAINRNLISHIKKAFANYKD